MALSSDQILNIQVDMDDGINFMMLSIEYIFVDFDNISPLGSFIFKFQNLWANGVFVWKV